MDEFQEIGKKLPYQVPDGFFDHLPQNTLNRARNINQKTKSVVLLWRTVGVAASLVAAVFLVTLLLKPGKQENHLLVQEHQPKTEKLIEPAPKAVEEPTSQVVKNDPPQEKVPEVTTTEDLTDVLADLSDEELMQLNAMYQSDPLIGEEMQ